MKLCAQAWEETWFDFDSLKNDWNKLLLPQVASSVGSEEACNPEPSDTTGDIEDCFQQLGYFGGDPSW